MDDNVLCPAGRGALLEISPEKENWRVEHTAQVKGKRFEASEARNGVSEAPVGKLLAAVQLSLAELKQEVNAAKSLSNSASAVLQTNTGLQDVQHQLSAPRTTAPSTTPSLKPDDAKHVPDVPTTCEGGPAPADLAPRPELIQWLATGMALAQAMQQAENAGLDARLAALEARMCASLQGSLDSRRMTHDITLLGYEAVRAEDLNSVLGRLAEAEEVLGGLASLRARQGEAASVQHDQQLALAALQDAVTTCCESMDELQTATEGGHSNPAVQEAVGSLAARLGQAEKALQKAAAQQVGNSSRIAAMAAQRAHLQGGLEDCACQLASLREEVAQLAQQQETQQSGAAAEDVAGLRVQMETHPVAGAKEAGEVARQLSALESAQHETGAEVTAARSQLCLLSEGLAQANIALADVQDALEESAEGDGKAEVRAELAGLHARLRELANFGSAQGNMVIALAAETTEHHSTAMRLQHTLAQECQAMAQRQERLAAELTAVQRGMLALRGSMPVAELQAAMDALQSEQASQREAISCFTAQLAAGDTDLQACMRAVEVMTEQHEVAGSQLHSVRMAMRGQQTHLTELAVECDRRHEAAMKIQHSAATETAILGQQVMAGQGLQRAAMAAMKEDLQGQIADVAAGTNDLAEGQIVTAASLATAHSKVHMLAEAFKTQREHIQALAADNNAHQQTLVRLQRNAAHACNHELKELSTALGHVRLQVNDLGAATAERIERQDDDIFLLQNSLVEVGTLVQAMDADQNA